MGHGSSTEGTEECRIVLTMLGSADADRKTNGAVIVLRCFPKMNGSNWQLQNCEISSRDRKPKPETLDSRPQKPKAPCEGFPKLGIPFWGPYNQDYSILGSILEPRYFGKLACLKLQ